MLPVSVAPAILPPLEAASLVQPVALSIYLEPRDEFHVAHRVARGTLLRVANTQTQPALLAIKAHPARTRVGVPSAEQLGLVTQYKGAITRTHQLLGASWQVVATQKTVATSVQVKLAAAGAQALVIAIRVWQVSGRSLMVYLYQLARLPGEAHRQVSHGAKHQCHEQCGIVAVKYYRAQRQQREQPQHIPKRLFHHLQLNDPCKF